MRKEKMETVMGMCVITLTKYIMQKEKIDHEKAYRRLLNSELYQLLNDEETRLFLEHDHYLCKAYDAECLKGKDGLYSFINTSASE